MHCHLDLMENMLSLIKQSETAQVELFAVGTTPKAYLKEIGFVNHSSNINVGLGLHPQLIEERFLEVELLLKYLPNAKYVGEIGLDFSRSYINSKDKQLTVLRKIIDQCEVHGNKVVSIHAVKAIDEVLDIIEEMRKTSTNKYIIHWFSGTNKQLKRAIDLGLYFSINPKMTKTKSGVSNIKLIPKERLLLETDAPFVASFSSIKDLEASLLQLLQKICELRNEDCKEQICLNSNLLMEY